jgi:hypothetical protein
MANTEEELGPGGDAVLMLMQDLDRLRRQYARMNTITVAAFIGALESYKYIILSGDIDDDDDGDDVVADPPPVATRRGR